MPRGIKGSGPYSKFKNTEAPRIRKVVSRRKRAEIDALDFTPNNDEIVAARRSKDLEDIKQLADATMGLVKDVRAQLLSDNEELKSLNTELKHKITFLEDQISMVRLAVKGSITVHNNKTGETEA